MDAGIGLKRDCDNAKLLYCRHLRRKTVNEQQLLHLSPTDESTSLAARMKRLFLRGLAALLPTLVTLMIFIKLIGFVNENIGKYIGHGIVRGAAWLAPGLIEPNDEQLEAYIEQKGLSSRLADPEKAGQVRADARRQLRRQVVQQLTDSWQMSVLGFLLAIVLVCALGLFLASFIGRRVWRMLESTLIRMPIVRNIYPYVKQVTDYVFGQRRLEFSRVVAVEYPRKGIWSIGFVTGTGLDSVYDQETVAVFIPSSPTPLTGYVITVPRKDVLDLAITADEAIRFVISGGVIKPGTPLISDTDEES